MDEITNAAASARIFYARHMQPGVCKYDKYTVLVDTDALKRMIANFSPVPVFIDHPPDGWETMGKELAKGYVTESFYNELDGWAWFKFIAIDEDTQSAIARGWRVSNGYRGSEFAQGGTKNNVPFEREIKDGRFTQLAIVPDPRYEGACVMTPEEFKVYQDKLKAQLEEMRNSKPSSEGIKMLKLFKNTKQEVTEIDDQTMVDLGDGKSVSIGEMINSLTKAKAEEELKNKKSKEMLNGDSEVDVGDEKIPLKELVNRYNAMCEQKNAAEKEAKEKEEKEKLEIEQKNAKEAADKKAADDLKAKEELAHFEELKNAREQAEKQTTVKIEAPQNALLRGKQRY